MMVQHIKGLGANTVMSFRLDGNEVGEYMDEILTSSPPLGRGFPEVLRVTPLYGRYSVSHIRVADPPPGIAGEVGSRPPFSKN